MAVIYFNVRNFDLLQHYKDRNPPWIKLYNDLLDDYAFSSLPDASKLHYIMICLLASRSNNQLPYDSKWIAKRINATESVNLELLIEAGLIEKIESNINKNHSSRSSKNHASDMLATRYQDDSGLIQENKNNARPETETETEGETETEYTSSNEDVVDQQADPPSQNADKKNLKPPAQPACPYDDIIALYHKFCPTNPVMRERTKARDDHLRARWREYPDLAWWEQFFEIVAESKFLTGRVTARDRRPFLASLPWLVKPENFAKVLDGNYD